MDGRAQKISTAWEGWEGVILLNFLNFIYRQYCYQLYYSFFFGCFVEIKKIPLWTSSDMMTINFDTITNNYEVIYVIKTVMKYYLKKIDTSFHQPLPNMVQRLFADVINDAIWFMNIHEPNHP
jgi:hypothetical protein